jgi:DNA repair ATPase RecN
MAGLTQAEDHAVAAGRPHTRGVDRTQALAALALVVALLSLVVGFSRASPNDVEDVRAALSDVANSAVTQRDLQEVETRLDAIETSAGDAQDAIAELSELTSDMADASKVDAIVDDLRSSIDSLRSDVNDLCDAMNSSSTIQLWYTGC